MAAVAQQKEKKRGREASTGSTGENMPEMFRNIREEDLEKMMSTMMPAMMEKFASSMDPEEMTSTMHEMVPKMMESCFGKMSVEQRKGMLSMCRSMLDELEQKHT